jgi:hypothetical protein
MQQIADWLKTLGMSEYAQRFAENRIDFTVLRDMTDQDLKDLGVVLGDRRKMLRAIAELGGAVPASPQPTEAVFQLSGSPNFASPHLKRSVAFISASVPLASEDSQIGVRMRVCLYGQDRTYPGSS